MFTAVPHKKPVELYDFYPEFAWYYPRCELQTKRWFVENVRDDWTIFDVGANIGYYSVLFSRLAPKGSVVAFEPTETVVKLLRNLSGHRIENVKVEAIALSDAGGFREDAVFRIWGEAAERQSYLFDTIDNYVSTRGVERVDCIKIDTDSFDYEVLRGGEKTMRRDNPYVVVELNHALSRRNQSATEAMQWLQDQGYDEALVLDYENFVLKKRGSATGSSLAAGITLHFDRRPVDELSLAFAGFEPLGYVASNPVSENAASVQADADGWRVEFEGPIWSNVAHFAIDPGKAEAFGAMRFEIDIEVVDGLAGVGAFRRAGERFAAPEIQVAPGRHLVTIDSEEPADDILIRCHAPQGGVECLIRSVRAFCRGDHASATRAGARYLHDERPLDVEALRDAVRAATPPDPQPADAFPPAEAGQSADPHEDASTGPVREDASEASVEGPAT